MSENKLAQPLRPEDVWQMPYPAWYKILYQIFFRFALWNSLVITPTNNLQLQINQTFIAYQNWTDLIENLKYYGYEIETYTDDTGVHMKIENHITPHYIFQVFTVYKRKEQKRYYITIVYRRGEYCIILDHLRIGDFVHPIYY
jgi:hypothetical protein